MNNQPAATAAAVNPEGSFEERETRGPEVRQYQRGTLQQKAAELPGHARVSRVVERRQRLHPLGEVRRRQGRRDTGQQPGP